MLQICHIMTRQHLELHVTITVHAVVAFGILIVDIVLLMRAMVLMMAFVCRLLVRIQQFLNMDTVTLHTFHMI
ncbi:hypothetical protein X975_01740, partial [Stegodyphus mimosarum]